MARPRRLAPIALAALLAPALRAQPRVAATDPAQDAVVAGPALTVTVRFSEEMRTGSFSLVRAEGGEMPEIEGDPWFADPRTFQVKIRVAPGRRYALGFNTGARRPFASAGGRVPLEPFVLRFRTAEEDRAGGRPGLKVPLPLPKRPGGSIVFTRYVPVATPGVQGGTVPIPKLFVVAGEGGEAAPFLATPGWESFKQPRWAPRYAGLLFTSDWMSSLSVCLEDVFLADGQGHAARLTGNELKTPPPLGFGAVKGVVEDDFHTDEPGNVPFSVNQIHITAQGAGGVVVHPRPHHEHGLGPRVFPFAIPQVAAGKIWIKVWVDRNLGNWLIADVEPGRTTDVGTIKLKGGNLTAGSASITPDGKVVVGIGAFHTVITQAKSYPIEDPHNEPLSSTRTHTAAVSLTAWGAPAGQILVNYDSTRLGLGELVGAGPEDPVLSPDGRTIAVALGQPATTSLCLIPLAEFLADRPQPRVLVPFQRLLPQVHHPGFESIIHSAGSPAWSPDGKLLVFTRGTLVGDRITAELCAIAPDGTGLRQLTNLGGSQLAGQACFSPDGRKVVFTLVTAQAGPLTLEALLLRRIRCDLFVLDLQGGQVSRLTRDGASCEPAWGP